MAPARSRFANSLRIAAPSMSAIITADFSKIRTQLGWEPKRALRETIETTLSYFKGSLSHYL